MLKIGDFAKRSGVTVKTLRYYDELGLLKPARVDERSGYRYYSADQLLTIKRIAYFKEEGFTLEQIRTFLNEDTSSPGVKTALFTKHSELKNAIHEAQRQLDEINERINQLSDIKSLDEVSQITIRSEPSVLVASLRDQIPMSSLCLLLDEIKQHVRKHGENENRPLTVLWHRRNPEDGLVDVEVAIPVSSSIPETGKVRVVWLPAIQSAASLIHACDPYALFCPKISHVQAWVVSNGYLQSPLEAIREIIMTPDKNMYGRQQMAELLIPIQAESTNLP